MATTAAVTTRAYPKRKRVEVSYKESSSDESEVDDEYGASNEALAAPARKKLKASSTIVSVKPLPKRKIFPFMSLPAELKNEIYALALTDPDGMFLVSKTKRYRRTIQRSVPRAVNKSGYYRRSRGFRYQLQLSESTTTTTVITVPALTPNIVLLNRAIYAETQPILYAGNTFTLEDTTALHAFLANIGPKNCATITDITLRGWGFTKAHKALNHPAFTMLASAVNLGRLHLDCYVGWGGPRRLARQLYRDGFHWLEAMGVAKGKYDAAIEVIEISDDNWIGLGNTGFIEDETRERKTEEFRAELRRMLH